MKNKGFTLLELLIVIIIIGLLASIGIVQYSKAISNAKNTQARTVLTEMRKAALAWQSVNRTAAVLWPAMASGGNISADLDGDGILDVNYQPTLSNDFTYTCTVAGVGTAAKQANAGAGVFTWTIDFETSEITSS